VFAVTFLGLVLKTMESGAAHELAPFVPAVAVSLFMQHKGLFIVFIQLVIRPFWADFDLRDRPPVYKTAALPIELRRVLQRVSQDPNGPT